MEERPERNRHVPVHRHRGLDGPPPAAARRLRRRARDARPAAAAGVRGAGRPGDRHAGRLVLRRVQQPEGRGRTQPSPPAARCRRAGRREPRCGPDGHPHGRRVARGDRYLGLSVHRRRAICSAGHGGQILISQTTSRCSRTTRRSCPARSQRPRRQRLKDFDRPIQALPASSSRACRSRFRR
jgi:hypothetical protein